MSASSAQIVDRRWLADNPLPVHGDGTDKNSRGRVLAAGGSARVPGALRLTAEGALRAGAGKVRMATIAEAAIALGVAMPEAGVVALPTEDGEIASAAIPLLKEELAHCDTAVLGPGIFDRAAAARLLAELTGAPDARLSFVLDAACVACALPVADQLRRHEGRIVLTPHHGEMAACLECESDTIDAAPEEAATRAADRFGAVVVLKAARTVIAAPGQPMLHYPGGGVGLATGGSGDILAGIIAGLMSRGAEPRLAAAWGVWLHGEAGARLAESGTTLGFLARELLPEIPRLMV